MRPLADRQSEEQIDQELQQLPDLPAPETLFHRVMLAVHERERKSWWQRPWLSWPPQAQIVSMAIMLAGVGVVALLLGQARAELSIEPALILEAAGLGWLLDIWDVLGTIASAGLVVLKAGGQQCLMLGSAVVLLAYLACVGVGTACWRVVASRA